MSHQVTNRLVIGLLALLALAASFVLGTYDWFPDTIDVKRSRLILAGNTLRLGATSAEAAVSLLTALGAGGLQVHRNGDETQWYVSNGEEFFETNWVLTVCFQNQVVTGVRFGTTDDVTSLPSDAPATRGTCASA